MQLSGNTILITGGASGIGLALATRFLAAGSEVIVCGRRAEKLREARAAHPKLHTRVCDLADDGDRVTLCDWAIRAHPNLNVIINNAGIQRYPSLAQPEAWPVTREELVVNLEAPMHLNALLIPHFLKQPRAAIMNVTSGLAFVPMARAPIYSATKAALRSYTLTLRHQLAGTPVEVIEIIPPAVDTDLGGPGLHTFGVNVDEYADIAMAGIERGDREIPFGFSAEGLKATYDERNAIFERMNQPKK